MANIIVDDLEDKLRKSELRLKAEIMKREAWEEKLHKQISEQFGGIKQKFEHMDDMLSSIHLQLLRLTEPQFQFQPSSQNAQHQPLPHQPPLQPTTTVPISEIEILPVKIAPKLQIPSTISLSSSPPLPSPPPFLPRPPQNRVQIMMATTETKHTSSKLQQRGKHALKKDVKVGGEHDTFAEIAFLLMYVKSGEIRLSMKIFKWMPKKNDIVWATNTQGIAENVSGEETLRFFEEVGFGLVDILFDFAFQLFDNMFKPTLKHKKVVSGMNSWCSKIRQWILHLRTHMFDALNMGLRSKTGRMSRDSLAATAWLGLELTKGLDGLRRAACEILLHSVVQWVQTTPFVVGTKEHEKFVTCLTLYEPGNCLLSGSADKTIWMWQMLQRNLECIEVIPTKEFVRNIDCAGELIFSTIQSRKLKVIEASRQPKDEFKNKHVKCITVKQGKVYAGCLNSSIQELMVMNLRLQEMEAPSKSWIQNKPITLIFIYEDWVRSASLVVDSLKIKDRRRNNTAQTSIVPHKGVSKWGKHKRLIKLVVHLVKIEQMSLSLYMNRLTCVVALNLKDRTTTASVLACEIIKLGLLGVTSGANSLAVMKRVDKIGRNLVRKVKLVKGGFSSSVVLKEIIFCELGHLTCSMAIGAYGVSGQVEVAWVLHDYAKFEKWHQRYDSRYASLVKIAESLNYRALLYDSILSVLDILGNGIVEHDVVIVFNNWSNVERDGNVMITSTVMVTRYNGVGHVEDSWSLINHFMMLSSFEDAHKFGDDMDKMLIGWLIEKYSFKPQFKMGNIWRHSYELGTVVCAPWNIFLDNILHHRGRALAQWAEKSQPQTIAKIHMANQWGAALADDGMGWLIFDLRQKRKQYFLLAAASTETTSKEAVPPPLSILLYPSSNSNLVWDDTQVEELFDGFLAFALLANLSVDIMPLKMFDNKDETDFVYWTNILGMYVEMGDLAGANLIFEGQNIDFCCIASVKKFSIGINVGMLQDNNFRKSGSELTNILCANRLGMVMIVSSNLLPTTKKTANLVLDRPLPKPPPQFLHMSLGDKTL